MGSSMNRDLSFEAPPVDGWQPVFGERVYLRKFKGSVTNTIARTGEVILVADGFVKVVAPYKSVRPQRVTLWIKDVRPFKAATAGSVAPAEGK